MADQDRSYKIGERNPRTIEDPYTEAKRASFWRNIRRWAETPGGKHYGS
jgi:hypothetical protein